MVTRNTPPSTPCSSQHKVTYNEDGSANVEPPREFLLQAQVQWESSLIGHFIGTSFSFKFVKEQAFKIWQNKGLSRVFYSSKHYFTFKYNTVAEKDAILKLNLVQIGGKTLYLSPWMEGSKFKKNLVDRVLVWIKLVDVPQHYWYREGLCSIASAIGKPLKFDEATARFEPLKYAGIQVELIYAAPRPDYVWASILNGDGEFEKAQVVVLYPQLPYSCSLCEGFGHSLSRCNKNPEAVCPPSRTRVSENFVENLLDSRSPYIVGKLFGCDVVLDDDMAHEQAKASMQNDVDINDRVLAPQTDPELKDSTDEPNTKNCFAALAHLKEGEIEALEEEALIRSVEKSPQRKPKHTRSPKMDHALVVDLGRAARDSSLMHPSAPKKKDDKEGSTPVISKNSLRRAHFAKSFQYFNFMSDLDNFRETVASAWNEPWFGDPMAILCRKLKCVKGALVTLNKRHGNLHSREEALLRQKSRVNWLHLGDGNNRFFHNQVKSNWNRDKILAIENKEGAMVFGHNLVAGVAVNYFSDTIGLASPTQPCMLEDLDFPTISAEHSTFVEAPVSSDLILKTLKGMKQNKAPGPDGFPVEFYLPTWDIVGPVFCEAVQHFFHTSVIHTGINNTGISLIPKVANPTNMKDFRPISLCNIAYKCIANILASRLKHVLPSIINISQSAFVKGRHISDNILMAQELFRGYSRETGVPKCALKIDLHKAFDSLDWNFLMTALHKLGFPSKFLGWIYACISTSMYSIKINGILSGYFKGKKGLRQGDPMSPYLFTVAMNVLSSLLMKIPDDFKFHWKCRELNLTYLFYADDVLLFSRGDEASVMHNI
ncbi:uncharacterized protein LOC141680033 [Apium graveolens]|uniref:uncharacterized protein LOC141680033 n=1 Tax=Apium graveolens TaxID=4045 RepID=UPI003D7AB9FD